MITIRPATAADNDLIYGAWMRKLKSVLRMADFVHNDSFYDDAKVAISSTLARTPGAIIAEAEGAALGFAVAGSTGQLVRLHWIHVKPEFRKLGIGSSLVKSIIEPSARLDLAYPTAFIKTIRRFHRETYYNPFTR